MLYSNSNKHSAPSEHEVDILDKQKIINYLQGDNFNIDNLEMSIFDSIDSTNNVLKKITANELSKTKNSNESSNKILIAIAEEQTAGRGRFGRTWDSPYGENIYFSIKYPITKYSSASTSQLGAFSLCVSLCLVKVFEEINIFDLKIKWPNDILYLDKKLSGILVELNQTNNLKAKHKEHKELIIGIGINVNSVFNDPKKCSLLEITHTRFERNFLIAKIIIKLTQFFDIFMQSALASFYDLWKQYDYLLHKKISVQAINSNKAAIIGIAQGINTNGELLVQDENLNILTLNTGETTLHKE